MQIFGEQRLPAPRERVWELFNDPHRLTRLIPGCEKLDQLASDEFAGTINVGIAAIKGVYSGKLRLNQTTGHWYSVKLFEKTLLVQSERSRASDEVEEQARPWFGGLRLRPVTLRPNGDGINCQ